MADVRAAIADVKASCLKSLLRRMNIQAVLAEGEIRACLQSRLGNKKGGHWLITVEDFERIKEKRKLSSGQETAYFPVTSENEGNHEECSDITEKETQTDGCVSRENKNIRKQRKSKEIVSVQLAEEFDRISEFYRKVVNPERPSGHIAVTTIKKITSRAMEYYIYLFEKDGRLPKIEYCLEIEMVERFVDNLIAKGLSYGTVAGYAQCLLYVAKYLHRKSKHTGSHLEIQEIVELKTMQSQLQASDLL